MTVRNCWQGSRTRASCTATSSCRPAAHATSYVDLRRVTLDGRLAPLVGRVLLERHRGPGLRRGRRPDARRGPGSHRDAARRGQPGHPDRRVRRAKGREGARPAAQDRGTRRDGPPGARVEDTSTTGSSVLTAVDALEAAGAEVIGVAVIVDRGAEAEGPRPRPALHRGVRTGRARHLTAPAADQAQP